ncbi:hypothetical protein Leryth_001937 [Lithospermum erythrorhizon]|nr:hypothetical protein Leryth_001937 [Lithospermum erythrorhizon]
MALKFLNKKGWHTGSLRNIENVWKAEQKHDAEQKKLEELKKQIQDERQKAEYRLIEQQAGLIAIIKQERLDFLYDSGLSSGKGSTSGGFKELESLTKPSDTEHLHWRSREASAKEEQQPSGLGALFEEKPQSANDSWRKLHSDPLLLIRKREQEALAHVKNNPVQMAMIRKSKISQKKVTKRLPPDKRDHEDLQRADCRSNLKADADYHEDLDQYYLPNLHLTKLLNLKRAARLREMQMDAELHEEQRWKRLKTAEESDAREATEARNSKGKNFLDAAQRSIYGTEKGGSSTIEESVRRRYHSPVRQATRTGMLSR